MIANDGGPYVLHDEIPFLNRLAASLIYVLQHVFPENRFLEAVRNRNIQAIRRSLSKKLQRQGRTQGRAIEVARRRDLGDREFVREYQNRGLPVIFEGAAAEWSCTKKWNLDYLKTELGDRKLELYESSGLIERHLDRTGGGNAPVLAEQITAKDFVTSIEQGSNKYMRFSSIMESERQLIADLDGSWLRRMRRTYFGAGYSSFIGAAKRITPIHAGTTAFFFIMADGEKKWTFYSASSSALLNPRRSGRSYNFSDVNIKAPDASKYPGFELLSRYECVLKKGDVLFVPTWLWHEVENLTESWGVRYGFGNLRTFLMYPSFVFVRLFLCQPSFFRVFYNLIIARTKANTTLITPQIFTD